MSHKMSSGDADYRALYPSNTALDWELEIVFPFSIEDSKFLMLLALAIDQRNGNILETQEGGCLQAGRIEGA